MELRELHLTRMPGMDAPFAVPGQPGLNLIVGPNGSGKSSLSRAALGLLWPDPATVGQIVSATWTIDGDAWHAERAGGPAVTWQREGQIAEAPALVPWHRAGIYRLSVLDLLKSATDQTDDELAGEIRRQLAGGVDLASIRKRFERTGKEGQGKAQALEETGRKIRDLLEQQRQLAEEQRRLGELIRQRAAAEEAAGHRDAFTAGRDLAAALRELQVAAEEAAAYPPVMERLLGDEDQRLSSLVADRDRAKDEVAAAATAGADAERDRDGADLADGGPDDAMIDTLNADLAAVRELTGDLRDADEDLTAAVTELERARQQLGPIEPPPPGEPVTMDAAATAIAELRDRDRERALCDGLDRLLARDDLGREGTAAAEPATLESARKALGSWLATTEPPTAWPLRLLPWLAVAGLLTVGGVLQPWRSGGWPGWLAIGLGLALIPTWLLLQRHARRDQARRRHEARAAYAATEVKEPDAWTRPTVGKALRGLLSQEAAAVQDRLRGQLRTTLLSERDQAAGRLEDCDPASDLDQAQILQRVATWHAATTAHAAAEAQQARLAEQLAARRTQLVERLAPWWKGEADDLAVLASAVTDLQRRRDRHVAALKRLKDASTQRDAAEERHDTAAAQITALLARVDLAEDGAAAALADHLARRDDYLETRNTVERLTRDRDRLHQACDDLPEPLAALAREALEYSAAKLHTAIEDADARAGRADELLKEITRIETRVQEARGDAQLADARAEEESLSRDLGAIRDTVRGNALATLLLERTAARYGAATEPPLLRRTQDLFVRFTGGRYGLTVIEGSDGIARFRAHDRASERGLALAELSDGTRAQLLLAARLAALPEHERGVRPPLFLDESLTASDAVRFEAVGNAILDLVRRDGRQVFYLTCDMADVSAWQQLLAVAGEDPAPVIDLAAVRGLATSAGAERLRPEPAMTIPKPGRDAAAYGAKLQVPPLVMGQAPAGVHLFHLLRDDLPLLHGLLTRRVTTLGELDALADDLLADKALDAAARERIDARGRAMSAFLDAYAVGRGRPIPAGAILHESGIKSTKLEEVDALAARFDGDASRLLAALHEKPARAVKGLRDLARTRIEEWLTEVGYLDPRPALDRQEVRRRTLRALRADLAGGSVDWTALDLLIDAWWTAIAGV